jgi:tetratricopeptide (TPR) repeat protein
MGGEESKENVSTSSVSADAIIKASSGFIHPKKRITQNFLLIWVDARIDESTEDCQNTLAQLQRVVNDINIFTKVNEAIDFLNEVHGMKAFLIVEGTIGQHLLPLIHDIPQLDAIYIFCDNKPEHEQWPNEYIKIKGAYTDIKPICQALQQAVKQCNQNSIAMSFVTVGEETSSQNLDQLEPSFMCTQIFKDIFLEMEHNEHSVKDFVQFCRDYYFNNTHKLKILDEFERHYYLQSPITWYMRGYFVYEMLNQALRTLEADTIINMGFFVRDLHQHIEKLYRNYISTHHKKSFIVYRGQGLLKTDFEKLVKSKGGLISFNNFLSTSEDPYVSLPFAKGALEDVNMVGILFKMTIDPSVSSTPFASIQKTSFFQTEEEILFSMPTIFCIGEINKIDNNNPLYQVDLKLTADDNQQLRTFTERIQSALVGATGWERLGILLVKIGHFDKAEELYKVLLEKTSDEDEKVLYYNSLGYIKDKQGDYEKPIEYYEKALEIRQKTLPPNHPHLATSYNNIGRVYDNTGEYEKARSFYEKALEIQQKNLSPNHPDLATSYNNIGSVYDEMGEYSKALSFYEKALEIYQKTLPQNHPHLATFYTNIGRVYRHMGEYSKARLFYEKSLEINQKTLLPNHHDLATSYNNIALEYDNMGEYSKALSFYEKALEIRQKTLPPNHPDLAASYGNIGLVYKNMGEYSEARSSYEKALDIFEKNLPPNHPDLATAYNNIGSVYKNMGEYSEALPFYEKALEIRQKTLPSSHPSLATSYNNIGSVYDDMGEYSKALSSYETALEIYEKTLPLNHPLLATTYNNIGWVYRNMSDYPKALGYFERALDISQHSLPPNHPDIQDIRKSVEVVRETL